MFLTFLAFSTLSTQMFFSRRQMVRELVPADMIKMQSSSEWKRAIVAAYNSDAGMYNANQGLQPSVSFRK